MRKFPCFLLSTPDTPPVQTGFRWGPGATLALGRQFCVHFALDVTGIPSRRVGGFVRLQAPRSAPFSEFEGVYIRQGNAVHVWVWPQAVVRLAVAQIEGPLGQLTVLPESFWGSAPRSGTLIQRCCVGIEALQFEGGLLKVDRWWPGEPEAQVLAEFAPGLALPLIWDSAQTRVAKGERWAKGAKPLSLIDESTDANGWASWVQKPFAWVALGWLTLGLVAGYGGLMWSQGRQIGTAKLAAQTELDELLSQASKVHKGRAAALDQDDVSWINEVKQATDGVRIDALLLQLAGPLSQRGLLIRELVVEQADIKLALVSGYGGDLDLDAAVAALESAGPWERVELLDFANPTQARFGLRAKGTAAAGRVQ